MNKVEFGQELDVVSSRKDEITKEEIFRIHKLKTSKYTFEGPLLIGALLGGAKQSDLEILKGYSTPLGLAFQLQDDILGVFGDESKLGKPVGSDIREGKKTFLLLKAKETCSKSDKKILESILGSKNLTAKNINKVREIITRSGSLEHNKQLIHELLKEAKDEISELEINGDGKTFMINLVDYLSERDY